MIDSIGGGVALNLADEAAVLGSSEGRLAMVDHREVKSQQSCRTDA